jgi:hypothetical protein
MTKGLKGIKAQVKGYRDDGSKAALTALAERAMRNEDFVGLGSAPPVIERNAKLESVWKDLLSDDPIDYSDPNKWREAADVRPSSFPFCPRKYVMERLGLRMPSDFRVESNFYTEIGKAVHYVAQNAIARTGKLWGFWSCPNPNCKNPDPRKFVSKKPSFLPESCKFCGFDKLAYEEIRLEYPEVGLRGHTDGIIVYKNYSSILEIKTSGDEKVTRLKSSSDEHVRLLFQTEAPWYGYLHQASTYASLANLTFPQIPEVKYVDYLIFSRDNPKNVASFRLSVPDMDWWREIRARIIMAQEARQLLILPLGFAKDQEDIGVLPSCKWCQHKDVCMNPGGKIKYSADALYSIEARQALDEVLTKERQWAASSEAT